MLVINTDYQTHHVGQTKCHQPGLVLSFVGRVPGPSALGWVICLNKQINSGVSYFCSCKCSVTWMVVLWMVVLWILDGGAIAIVPPHDENWSLIPVINTKCCLTLRPSFN